MHNIIQRIITNETISIIFLVTRGQRQNFLIKLFNLLIVGFFTLHVRLKMIRHKMTI